MDGSVLTDERRAILGLWAVPGLGPRALDAVRARFPNLGELLQARITEWLGAVELSVPVRTRLMAVERLSELADRVLERARAGGMGIAFVGDPMYPELLATIADAPPLLFYLGGPQPPRRRVAMVGSRKTDGNFQGYAKAFAARVASRGVGIVSGAAQGVDRACHHGALEAGEQTWAFLGSALDRMDPPQANLLPAVLDGRGAFFSELPPGVHADRETFPRRNRLISGSADAVLVLRAGDQSGSLHTAQAAMEQGRPMLVMPADVRNEYAIGSNELLRSGRARVCLSEEDVWAVLRVRDVSRVPEQAGEDRDESQLSAQARQALKALSRSPRSFEEVKGASGLGSGALTSALCELELFGLALQHPGKLYERI